VSGTTYKGLFHGTTVAVKLLIAVNPVEFINEVKLLMKLRHPCCIRLLGYTTTPQHMIVMDLYPCNLNTLLTTSTIELPTQKILALDVISGISYLHSNSIIHRDLKTSNILITENIRACIADFGLSKSISSLSNVTFNTVGTPTYIAPEICTSTSITYTAQSDYYSLGIILWEIFENNAKPFESEYPQIYDSMQFSVFQIAPFIHQNKIRPGFIELNKLKDVKQIITQLWHELPQKRPTNLTVVMDIIEKI